MLDLNLSNKLIHVDLIFQNVSVRHIVASRTYREKATMLYILHAIGASRCKTRFPDCNDGCSPEGSYDGVPMNTDLFCRSRICYDELLDSSILGKTLRDLQSEAPLG